jgi:hypothetical protein
MHAAGAKKCQSLSRRGNRRSSLAALHLQGPHRPAEVVTVLAEEGRRPMRPPVLRGAVRLPRLPRVAVAVRPVVPLHERRVDRPAGRRCGQRRLHRRDGPEDHPRRHLHHPPLLPGLVHGGIIQPRGRHFVRAPRPAAPAGPRRHHLFAERLQDRPLVGRIFVGRDQPRGPAAQPLLDLADQLLDRLRRPLPRDHRHHQPVLRVEGHVVPAVAAEPIVGLVLVAVLLLLGDERPRLVHLDLAGRGRAGDQLVVRGFGLRPGGAGVAGDGVGMDLDQPCRLADSAAFGDVLEDRGDLVLGQVGAVQRGPLALGEAGAAGAAIEQAILAGLAEPAGDGEVSGAAAAELRAPRIQATESGEVVHRSRCGLQEEARTGLGYHCNSRHYSTLFNFRGAQPDYRGGGYYRGYPYHHGWR